MGRSDIGPGLSGASGAVDISAEEAHHVLRNLSETGVKWLRANLHEHVAHVLDQDKLRLITGGSEVPIELDRLRLENRRVVDTLNKQDGRRVRSNVMRGTGKNQVPVIIRCRRLAECRRERTLMLAQ